MDKFSDLLDAYIEMKMNPYVDGEWISIDENSRRRNAFYDREMEICEAMDDMIASKGRGDE